MPSAILEISSDVTERKKAEAALHGVQEELRKHATMFDAAHDAIMTLDPEGTITYWNRGAERLYGWTTQEAEGQNANALLRTRFPESREVLWPKLMESGLWEGELIHVTRDGVEVTVASSWTLMKDDGGNPSAILEISSDITERKRAEHQLEESERRIREMTNALPVVVYETDTTGRMTFVNTTAFDLFGYAKEEIEAGVSIFQLIAPADRKRARAMFRRRMNEEDVGRVEYTGLRKDKSTFPVSIRAVVMMLDGVVIGQRGVILDITELSEAQEELRSMRRCLMQRTTAS